MLADFLLQNEMTPSESANFLWMNVPGRFECHPDNNEELGYACNQHIGSFVPCWVSRPYVSVCMCVSVFGCYRGKPLKKSTS